LLPIVTYRYVSLHAGLIHLGGCGIWLIKVATTDEEHVQEFLDRHRPDASAEFPSLSTPEGKMAAYVTCTYFVTTVFSTVGFGDISAVRCSLPCGFRAFSFGRLVSGV
jgi:hypothetical protein